MSKLYENEALESLLSGEPKPINKRPSWKRTAFVITTINLFILAITFLVPFVRYGKTEPSNYGDWVSCGNTSAEAIELGCTFDSMLSAWLHPDCFWADHFSSSLKASNTTFYLDTALSKPYGPNHGNWGQEYLYAENDYHIYHCTYMWERQIMIWYSGTKIDSLSWDPDHTKHCIQMVLGMNHVPDGQIAKLTEGFPSCGTPAWEEVEKRRRR